MTDQPSNEPLAPIDLEAALLSLIASAGEAQTLVMQAFGRALAGDIRGAHSKLAEADERLREAHHVQFRELIAREARGEVVPIRLLAIHGMDILATAAGHRELVTTYLQAQRQTRSDGEKLE